MQTLEKEALPSSHILIYKEFHFSQIIEMNQIKVFEVLWTWNFWEPLKSKRNRKDIILEHRNES